MRAFVCRRLGHRWDSRTLACRRCRKTALEIDQGHLDVEVEQRLADAYWRGVQDGRKIDRERAYRLGYMRGGRSVFQRLVESLRA